MLATVATPPAGRYRTTRSPDHVRPGSQESSSSFFDQTFGQWGDENPNLIEQARHLRSRENRSSGSKSSKSRPTSKGGRPTSKGFPRNSRRYLSEDNSYGGPFIQQGEQFDRKLLGDNTLYFEPLAHAHTDKPKRIKQSPMQMTMRGQNMWPDKKGQGTGKVSPIGNDGLPFPRLRNIDSRSRSTRTGNKPWIVRETAKTKARTELSNRRAKTFNSKEEAPKQSILEFTFEQEGPNKKRDYREKLAIGPTWGCDASYQSSKYHGRRGKTNSGQINIYSPGGSISLSASSGYIDEDGRLIGSPFTKAQKASQQSPVRESPYNADAYANGNQGQVIDPVIEASNVKKIREMMLKKGKGPPNDGRKASALEKPPVV
jgi:hypothetical protein